MRAGGYANGYTNDYDYNYAHDDGQPSACEAAVERWVRAAEVAEAVGAVEVVACFQAPEAQSYRLRTETARAVMLTARLSICLRRLS